MKIKNILCGIAFVLMAAACNDETFYVEAPKITTSTASIVLEGSDAGEAVFTFTANLPWHIEVSAATADASIGDIKVSPGKYQWPTRSNYIITSNYGWRICPFHGREFHNGLDVC